MTKLGLVWFATTVQLCGGQPTEGGRAYIGEVVEGEPYPGAKPCFVIEHRLEDREWLSELVRITTRELPVPKKRKRKKKT